MDKPNQFRSGNFFMDAGDVLHMILKGESGSSIISMELMRQGSSTPEDYGGNNLTDYDGNVYTEVTIGTQKWIIENFRCTHYADGTIIPELHNDVAWDADTDGACCWYGDDAITNVDYGLLYNWYAVNNGHGLPYLERGGVPEAGWRVPTKTDIEILEGYLGGSGMWYLIGERLKETGTGHWNSPNNANNNTGLTLLGSGSRSNSGTFSYQNIYGYIWESTSYTTYFAHRLQLINSYGLFSNSHVNKGSGYPVRLVKTMGAITSNYILAGTSPNGYILKSVNNGIGFVNEGSKNYGSIMCFCELTNGDILYGTDNGYIVNYTQGTYSQPAPTTVQITAIDESQYAGEDEMVIAGDDNGNIYLSVNHGNSFISDVSWNQPEKVRDLVYLGNGDCLVFADDGIYLNNVLMQTGDFNRVYDAGGGVMYVGDTTDNIWKSTDYGSSWVVAVTGIGFSVEFIKAVNGTRVIFYQRTESLYYTEDDFASTNLIAGTDTGNRFLDLIQVNEDVLLIGDDVGNILRSIDNGDTWTEIVSNPQQGESSIYRFIDID